MGHALMENRNGLIVGAVTTTASGHAERRAALALIEPAPTPRGRSRSLPTKGLPGGATTAPISSRRCATRPSSRMWHRTPPAAARRSTTTPTRHPGYAISQRIRKRVEEAFG